MRLMHGMIKDMKSRTIVGNCRSEKFFGVDIHCGSVLTPLLLIYARGSIHGIQNRLHIVAIVQR